MIDAVGEKAKNEVKGLVFATRGLLQPAVEDTETGSDLEAGRDIEIVPAAPKKSRRLGSNVGVKCTSANIRQISHTPIQGGLTHILSSGPVRHRGSQACISQVPRDR